MNSGRVDSGKESTAVEGTVGNESTEQEIALPQNSQTHVI